MRAVAVTQPGTIELVDLPTPTPGPYQALVKTELACLCNATDGKLVAGEFPGVEDYPLILGHESAGEVVEVGDKVRTFQCGDRAIGGLLFDFGGEPFASGWGGFCEYTLVTDHDAMVADDVADEAHGWFEACEIQRPVSPDIPVEEAVMLCTWREVLGAFGDFGLQPGQDILIYGLGPVGQSFVRFARLMGCGFVGAVGRHEMKRQRALDLGADAVFTPDSPELAAWLESIGKPLDAVIDAVGKASIINGALPMIRLGGTIGVYGVLGDPRVNLDLGKAPYNFNLIMHQWPTRWREREAQDPLCEWIRQGRLKASDFITHDFAMTDLDQALATARSGKAIKLSLRF